MAVLSPSLVSCGFVTVLLTQLFSLLTVPYFVGLHRDGFDTSLWGDWFRIFSFALTFFCSLVGSFSAIQGGVVLRRLASGGLTVGAMATVFNVLFGLRIAETVLCQGDIRDACMEPDYGCAVTITQYTGRVRVWEAFLFSFTMCALLCSLSVSVALLMRTLPHTSLTPVERVAVTQNQSSWDASITHDQSPPKASKTKTESLEKTDLIEPVFVPTKKVDQQPTFAKDSEVTDLVSSKDFEGSLGRGGNSLRSRGRGRGRGK